MIYRKGNNTYEVERLIGALSDEEQSWIGQGYWVDSDHVACRITMYEGNQLVGFLDVYDLPRYKGDGMVVLAVHPHYRGKGYAKSMVKQAIIKMKKQNKIHRLLWHVDEDNPTSMRLAETCGFTFIRVNTEKGNPQKVYEYGLVL